jgi:hypothetical protein
MGRGAATRFGLVLTAAMAALSWAAPAVSQTLAAAVKATYLYKLAPFVAWPQGAFDAPGSPLVICVQGEDPFGPLLDRAIAGQRVDGRPVTARRMPAVGKNSGCHLLFAGGSRLQPAAEALKAVRGEPVLTVTDARPNAPRGMVHFVVAGNRVRFVIDGPGANAHGLQLSSKLMALAVKETP